MKNFRIFMTVVTALMTVFWAVNTSAANSSPPGTDKRVASIEIAYAPVLTGNSVNVAVQGGETEISPQSFDVNEAAMTINQTAKRSDAEVVQWRQSFSFNLAINTTDAETFKSQTDNQRVGCKGDNVIKPVISASIDITCLSPGCMNYQGRTQNNTSMISGMTMAKEKSQSWNNSSNVNKT